MKIILIILGLAVLIIAAIVIVDQVSKRTGGNSLKSGDLAINQTTVSEMEVTDGVAEHNSTDAMQAVAGSEGEVEADAMVSTQSVDTEATATQTALVAGGCFWCVESDLEKLPGVIEAISGYAGGSTADPTYQNYYKGGHREVVAVTYNPSIVSYEEILIYTMKHMDPTDGAGSFGDRGVYYSPAFYYATNVEKEIAENLIAEVNENGPYDKDLEVAIESKPVFYAAEDYHQDYYKGSVSALKYKYYRQASGRNEFIEKYWGSDTGPDLPWRTTSTLNSAWQDFVKPSDSELEQSLTSIQYKVTQEEGTEKSFTNEYWDNKEAGLYVDVVSGEPLFSSIHKFDSGTGWPSFTRPIEYSFVTSHTDRKLVVARTEIRSAIADSHLGHVFNDAPAELGGIRYCMNSASLRFIPVADLESEGYGSFSYLFGE